MSLSTRLMSATAILLGLSACVPVIVGGAATTGVAAAQERTVGTALDDQTIHSKLTGSYFTKSDSLFSGVGVEVNEGVVLLTGQVKTQDDAIEAVKLAWQVPGVKEVINEIQVSERPNAQNFAQDTWITSQVKSRLILEKRVKAVNYSVETVNNVVYLIGIAQNAEELERAVLVASRVKGVQQVVSHVRTKDDPRRGAQ